LKRLDEFTLHELEALRLILTGGSVIDLNRLNLSSAESARKFLINHDLMLDDARDLAFTEHVKREAISYLAAIFVSRSRSRSNAPRSRSFW
jgi:uncharacterized protein (TIGR04552 family)